MALVVATLLNGLKGMVSNPDNFPDTFEQAALNFADVINNYGSAVTPPSTTSAAAKSACSAQFIASKSKQSLDIIIDAVQAYCQALALGMAPTFAGTPPPTTAAMKTAIDAAGQVALNGGAADDWAQAAATAIDAYFKTGIAVNSTTGVAVPWS